MNCLLSDLIDELTGQMEREAGLMDFQARKAVALILSEIGDALIKGTRAEFSGFGSFQVKIYESMCG